MCYVLFQHVTFSVTIFISIENPSIAQPLEYTYATSNPHYQRNAKKRMVKVTKLLKYFKGIQGSMTKNTKINLVPQCQSNYKALQPG